MRTTVNIPEPDYPRPRLKRRAANGSGIAKKLTATEGKRGFKRAVKPAVKKRSRKSGRRVKLPIIGSKQPGTLELDNERIFEIISFP